MNEFDKADFKGIYEGKSLLESTKITVLPWQIGGPQPIICEILETTPEGKLLDVGCGLGDNSIAAANRGYEVTAIDISSTAIQKCIETHVEHGITFLVTDACKTELETVFDVILDSATYHSIPSQQRIIYLKEMLRLSSEKTVFHIVTFAPSIHGMPKPLASELSEIANNIEASGWHIEAVKRVEYKGNAEAIQDFINKNRLKIELDSHGRTKLPAWHLILKNSL